MIRYYEQIGLIPRPTGTIRATAPIARTTYTGCTSSGARDLGFGGRDHGPAGTVERQVAPECRRQAPGAAAHLRAGPAHREHVGDGRDAQGADPVLRRRRTARLPDPAHAGATRYQRRRARSAHRRRATACSGNAAAKKPRALSSRETMPKITVLPHPELAPEGAELNVPVGTSICEALLDNGIEIEHACDMSCACTTCHCIVRKGFDSPTRSRSARTTCLTGPGARGAIAPELPGHRGERGPDRRDPEVHDQPCQGEPLGPSVPPRARRPAAGCSGRRRTDGVAA